MVTQESKGGVTLQPHTAETAKYLIFHIFFSGQISVTTKLAVV